DDPLLELVRGQLADLLDVIVLTLEGKPVMVDDFRLLSEPGTQYAIFPEAPAEAPGEKGVPLDDQLHHAE
ncbi:MAG: hypothetical protein QM473_15495, partial [Acidobacteriota bacterium]|nr:hypothetical protein [Acidobacteriota bacterium]